MHFLASTEKGKVWMEGEGLYFPVDGKRFHFVVHPPVSALEDTEDRDVSDVASGLRVAHIPYEGRFTGDTDVHNAIDRLLHIADKIGEPEMRKRLEAAEVRTV